MRRPMFPCAICGRPEAIVMLRKVPPSWRPQPRATFTLCPTHQQDYELDRFSLVEACSICVSIRGFVSRARRRGLTARQLKRSLTREWERRRQKRRRKLGRHDEMWRRAEWELLDPWQKAIAENGGWAVRLGATAYLLKGAA